MPIQTKCEFKGNRAKNRIHKMAISARGWGMLAKIKAEIAPPAQTPLDEVVYQPIRQANRRATDARATGRKNGDFYHHPEIGKPEAGVRMVSVTKDLTDSGE